MVLDIAKVCPVRCCLLSDFEAGSARRYGRKLGCQVETVLVLSDSAEVAVLRLAEEVQVDAI